MVAVKAEPTVTRDGMEIEKEAVATRNDSVLSTVSDGVTSV